MFRAIILVSSEISCDRVRDGCQREGLISL